MAVVVGTWLFSKAGVEAASDILGRGGKALDAVESAVRIVEEDASVTSVGYGGMPDARGVLSLDAAVMTSSGQLGAVMSLEGHRTAIPVARLVMESSPHTQLAGAGAAVFADEQGLRAQPQAELLTPHAKRRLAEHESSPPAPPPSDSRKHTDTVGVLSVDASGSLAAGVATSGSEFKAHGRVGDTPIVGAGIYASKAGGCVATGDGDRMLRHCAAVRVVDAIAGGMSASDACFRVVERIAREDKGCQAAVLALGKDGSVGAATTHRGFPVVLWRAGSEVEVLDARAVSETAWVHSCL